MGVQVGQLFRKRTVRNLDGSIRELSDEANGGVIISNGRVVNQERINEMARIEQDKANAGQASAHQVESPNVAQRTGEKPVDTIVPHTPPPVTPPTPEVVPEPKPDLEKRVDDMDTKLDAILKALNK